MSTVTEPIADLLARVRNAATAQKTEMFVPYSKIKAEIVRILKDEGYITDYSVDTEGAHPRIKITNKVANRRSAITGLKRVSRPGLRRKHSLDLSQEDKDLLKLARDAVSNAYARYSSFKVGAAVRTRTGTVYSGCNVENVSYPIGTCAERNAIAAAVLGEGPEIKIAAIAVAAQGKNGQWTAVIPCGACRQAIFEFGPDARVAFTDADGSDRVETIGNLLPEAFSF